VSNDGYGITLAAHWRYVSTTLSCLVRYGVNVTEMSIYFFK